MYTQERRQRIILTSRNARSSRLLTWIWMSCATWRREFRLKDTDASMLHSNFRDLVLLRKWSQAVSAETSVTFYQTKRLSYSKRCESLTFTSSSFNSRRRSKDSPPLQRGREKRPVDGGVHSPRNFRLLLDFAPFWPMSTNLKCVPQAKIVTLLWTKMARKVETDKKDAECRRRWGGVGDERFHRLEGAEVVDWRLSTGIDRNRTLCGEESRTYFFGNLQIAGNTLTF